MGATPDGPAGLARALRWLDSPSSPLEMELLDLLARAAPYPVDRYELSERLEVSLEMLYRLVYRLHSRLGERVVLRVGRSTTRHGPAHGHIESMSTLELTLRKQGSGS